ADYVARYSSRPAKLADMPLHDRVEMIQALHGKRLSGTFGTAKTVTLTPPKLENTSEWQQIGYFDEVVASASENPLAKAVLEAWESEEPLTEEEFYAYTGIDNSKPAKVFKPPAVKQYNLEFYNASLNTGIET
ncbi:unnamed protein product, partial [marine sediment metagenome]